MNRGQLAGVARNPRRITRERLSTLCRSLASDPEMLEARELIVYPLGEEYVIIGGNARYEAIKKLGISSVPCKVLPADMPASKLRAIAIKDNISSGAWDVELLLSDWDTDMLVDWGLDFEEPQGRKRRKDAIDEDCPDADDIVEDDKESFYRSMLIDCLYDSDNEYDIPNLRLDMQAGKLELPLAAYGAESRQKQGIATYHFYVEDYRFESIWKDPTKVLRSGCRAIVEPNLSLFDTTPVAYGLQQLYKKRWISRYYQECGIGVYADLNVARKFYDYNRMGIPAGYDAFCTRGYADRMEYLTAEYDIAREISGKDTPNLIVYGGGKAVKSFCAAHSLVYVEQLMTAKRNG